MLLGNKNYYRINKVLLEFNLNQTPVNLTITSQKFWQRIVDS